MSKDFITNQILSDTAQAIRHCENSIGGIAPVDFADRIRALDKLIPQPDALNFYMPNGGTISLNKTGSPTVVELEYSLDRGATWTVWPEDQDGNRSLILTAGQRMYIRNTSTSSTGFGTGTTAYYNFAFTDNCYADGNTNSLLCKNPEDAVITNLCYRRLYSGCSTLLQASKLPSTVLANNCYNSMFENSGITASPYLPAAVVPYQAYRQLFYGCTSITNIKTSMTDISAENSIYRWLYSASSTGDIYCDANLTIPSGASGIPSGWTRHDLT